MKGNVALFLVGVIISVGMSMTYADQKNDREFYCQMVAEGAWPAFDGECK